MADRVGGLELAIQRASRPVNSTGASALALVSVGIAALDAEAVERVLAEPEAREQVAAILASRSVDEQPPAAQEDAKPQDAGAEAAPAAAAPTQPATPASAPLPEPAKGFRTSTMKKQVELWEATAPAN
jgi:hypothetical protein